MSNVPVPHDSTVQTETQVPVVKTVRTLRPPVDILEGEAGFRLLVDLPGVSAEDLTVDFDAGKLSLTGLRHLSQKSRDGSRLAVAYERAFELPDSVAPDGIAARFNGGVLELELPKAEAAKARKIEVNVG